MRTFCLIWNSAIFRHTIREIVNHCNQWKSWCWCVQRLRFNFLRRDRDSDRLWRRLHWSMEQAIATMHKLTETSTSSMNRWNKNTLLCFEWSSQKGCQCGSCIWVQLLCSLFQHAELRSRLLKRRKAGWRQVAGYGDTRSDTLALVRVSAPAHLCSEAGSRWLTYNICCVWSLARLCSKTQRCAFYIIL